MNIYVGNLSWDTTEEALRSLFATYGAVTSAAIITDKHTGRSRGFGFVEMAAAGDAKAAIDALNGTELDGRALTVNEARPREKRSSSGGGGGYNRSGGSGGGGRRDYGDRGGSSW